MKKNYLFLAAAATMFTACVQTDVVNDIPEPQQQAIGFDAFANKTTRAEINSTEDLETVNEGQFTVWGWKTQSDARNTVSQIFTGQEVNWDATKGWNYTPLKYWDKMATYDFYAAAPKKGSATFSIDANKKISISNVVSGVATGNGAATDYLITRNVTTHYGANGGTVNFTFSHIMSKITVNVIKDDALADFTVQLTDLSMEGWDKNLGTFTQDKEVEIETTSAEGQTKTEMVLKEWELATSEREKGTHTFLTAANQDLSEVDDQAYKVGSYLMVPQENVDLKFTISYKIGAETFLAHTGTIEDQTWATNTHYIYTITVGPEAILFDVSTVNKWTTGTPQPGLNIE